MKIVVIDNGGFKKLQNGKYSIHHQTGMFGVELLNMGNEVTYFQIYSESLSQINDCDIIEFGVKTSLVKRRNSKLTTYTIAYLKAILLIIKSDFVYIFWPNSFKYLVFVAKLFNKKYGLYVRGQNDMHNSTSKYIFKKSYIIASVAESFTNYFKELGVKKAITIRPMIDLELNDIIYDRKYKIKNFYSILFLGRVEQDKGITELLESVKILIQDHKYNIKLNIIGTGSKIDYVRKFVNDNLLNEHVNLLGVVNNKSELREAYLNSDIYILPTYHEGFPRTLYEAMTFGTPIITTFVGGIPSLMKNKINCYEIEPKSSLSIVNVVAEVISSYDSVESLTKQGQLIMENILNPLKLTHAQLIDQIIHGKIND